MNSQDQLTYFSKGLFEEDLPHTGIALVEANGGYYLAGHVATSVSEVDIVIRFLDEYGDLIWTRTLVESGEYFEAAISRGGQMVLASDNTLVLAYTVADQGTFGHHNVVVRKIDFEGEDIWLFETDLGNVDEELDPVLIEGHQEDFFVVYDYIKLEQGFDPQKFGITKLSSEGIELWTKQILDESNLSVGMAGRSIIAHSSGNYFVGGSYGAFQDFQDMIIFKFDENGNEIWRKGFGDDSREGHAFITELENGNIWFTTQRSVENSSGPDTKYPQIGVIDTEGNLLHNVIYDFDTESNFTGQFGLRSTQARINNNVYGFTNRTYVRDFAYPWLWKVNAQADTVFTQTLTWNDSIFTEILDLEPTMDGGLVAAGYTMPPIDTTSGELVMPQMAWLVKMDTLGNFCHPLGCDSTVLISSNALENVLERDEVELSVSPNPSSVDRVQLIYDVPEELLHCKWHLFDMNGIEKRSYYLSSGKGLETVPLRHCAPGLYTWVLEYNGHLLKRGKLVLE